MSKMQEYLEYLKAPKVSDGFYASPVHLPIHPTNQAYDMIEYHINPELQIIKVLTYYKEAPELTKQMELFHYSDLYTPDPIIKEIQDAYVDKYIDDKARKT